MSQSKLAPAFDPSEVLRQARAWGAELGFQQLAVAKLELDEDYRYLTAWLDAGRHGSMNWLARNGELRQQPDKLVAGTLTVLSVRVDYLRNTVADAVATLERDDIGYVSRYALGRDYHKIIRGRLRQLAERLQQTIGPFGYRAFTDSAPVLERALARNAGIGWIGKHTNLINRSDGSMFFLGEIFTDLELPVDADQAGNHCGSCTTCIEVCPTQAITAPYQLDARRCISYLTIESKASIPLDLRPAIGNRIFGCDDCQLFCPWNRYAKLSPIADFNPRHGLEHSQLTALFALDENEFDALTQGSAIRRISFAQWLRNLAVALGNAPSSPEVHEALLARQNYPDPMVREHVDWALSRHRAA